jgi:plastocyanin
MRKTILRLAALSLVALVLFAPTAGAQGETMTVSIKNFAFDPANATVAPGTTVTWVNNDQVPHTATANDGAFDSGTLQPGQSYSFAFDKPGTYAYHCNIHPYMTATVTVSGASASASASASGSASPTASASPSASPSGSASASASGSASASSSGSAMATSPTASAITSPPASASTQQLPSSGGSTLELVAGLALVAFAIALVLVLVRRGAAS